MVAGILVALTVLEMTANRHLPRDLSPVGVLDAVPLPGRPQWEVLMVFLASFVLALDLVARMLPLFTGREREVGGKAWGLQDGP